MGREQRQVDNRPRRSISHSRPDVSEADVRAVLQQLVSGELASGKMVRRFEEAVARYLGLSGGVATNSGTEALYLALLALDIKEGDDVIIPSYVCGNVLRAVTATGARPVLADIQEDWCVGVETLKHQLTDRTRAIIVVHTFGVSADVKSIAALGIPVIEDCAQAFGGMLGEEKLGGYGQLCVCSFHATKLLSTGEGGMVLSRDGMMLEKIRSIYSGRERSKSQFLSRQMTDIAAALGISQLGRYDQFLKKRREIAARYFDELSGMALKLPEHVSDRSIFYRFPIRTEQEFEPIKAYFNAHEIQVRRGVDTLLHRVIGLDSRKYPISERRYASTISLPLYPAMTDEDEEYLINVCRSVFGS